MEELVKIVALLPEETRREAEEILRDWMSLATGVERANRVTDEKLLEKFLKTRMDNYAIGKRVSQEFEDGDYVNIGFGIPSFAPTFVPEGKTVIYQLEDGALNVGGITSEDNPQEWDHDLVNAGFRPVYSKPGMSFFDSAQSFAMHRGGHLDVSVVGGLQVSERGDLASWSSFWAEVGGRKRWMGILGGSMEVTIAKRVIVAMEHITKDGEFKIVKDCTYDLTRKGCVDRIITDLAVIDVTDKGLVLREMAPGWTAEEVQALTEPKLILTPELKEIEL